MMDRMPILVKSRVIPAAKKPYPLPKGSSLDVGMDIDAYMNDQRAAALIIIHNGKVRLEKYGLDFAPGKRWTSFSVAKSFTSVLLGAAIKDGYIRSVDDMVSAYIPDLKGSVYDDVSIKQLLSMTSGVQWNEDYGDPKSDVNMFNAHKAESGVDVTVSYMRQLKRAAPSGTKWLYNTGETNLIGVLVSSAINKSLSEYLSEKIWQPFGMEQDASWLLGATEHEISGCCIQASIHDFARFGLFMLAGGVIDGKSIFPDGWIAEATIMDPEKAKQHIKNNTASYGPYGYAYQWWTLNDTAYLGRGIFGQGIFIDPKRKLVIASNGNWPYPTDYQGGHQDKKRLAFYKQVQLAIDKER